MTAVDEVDVVVIGGGGAGLAAAIEAAHLGRTVLLLEKNARVGGTTVRSVGSISATSTPHQIKRGILDRPCDHYEDIPGFSGKWPGRDNPALRRLLTDAMPDTFRWLEGLGLVFLGPMDEPPHRRPRMHTVLPNSSAYGYQLRAEALRCGVRIDCGRVASELVEREGRIAGVRHEGSSGERISWAGGGVVLATGDYSASEDLKKEYISDEASRAVAINPSSTGDGHKLARQLGAQILNGDILVGPQLRFPAPEMGTWLNWIPPWRVVGLTIKWAMEHLPPWVLRPFVMQAVTAALAPSLNLFKDGAMLVSSQGSRCTGSAERLASVLAATGDDCGYIVLDQELARRFSAWPSFISTAPGIAYAYLPDYRTSRPDVFREAASLEALAMQLNIPAEKFLAAVRLHNADAADKGGSMISEPPFVALGPVRPYIIFTDGGLAIDDRMRVLKEDGEPIPGLYAAGSAGQGGLLLDGHGHHLGWAFTSGRIAGRQAAFGKVS